MDHMRIIRRAFDITRIYRALWVFGILLALTTTRSGGSSPGGGSGGNNSGNFPGPSFPDRWPNFPWPNIPNWGAIAGIAVSLICLILLIGVAFAVLRYVATTASVRMVDGYENTGEKVTVRQGFRLGWNNRSWRVFLINLLFTVLVLAGLIAGLAIAAAPLLLMTTRNEALSILGVLTTVGLGLILLFALIVTAIGLRVLTEFFTRAVIIENLGVMDAIRRGWKVATRRLGDTVVMGLLLFGINLGLTLLFIPVVIVLLLVAGVSGGIPGLLAGGLTSLAAQDWQAVVVGLLVGLPIFLVVLVLPLLFVRGLIETFFSAAWTLAYRDLVALENGVLPGPLSPLAPVPAVTDTVASDEPPAPQEPPEAVQE